MKILKDHGLVDRGIVLFFSGVFVFLYFLNAIFPTQSDDMGCTIGGLSAAIQSYNTWNGRLGELLRVAFGSYLATTVWYAPINAFAGASVILLLFIVVFARVPKFTLKDSSVFLILIAFILVDNSCCFGSVFYWAAGSFNYLWTWLLIFLWVLPYRLYWQHIIEKQDQNYENNLIKTIFVFVIGFCVGWSTEFGIVFIFLQLCLVVYQYGIRKDTLPLWYFTGGLSLFAGWFMLYTCPGTAARIQAFLNYGYDYLALSEIIRMPFDVLIKTIIHTYNRVLRWPYYENYVLVSSFLFVVSVFDKPSLKKIVKAIAVILFMGIVLFFLPRFVFLMVAFCIALLYAYTLRHENRNAARMFFIISCVLFAELVFIGATIQVGIPRRAGFQYTVLNFILIAVLMNYCFDLFVGRSKVRLTACICCAVFTFFIVLFVGVECYRMRLKWNAMEKSIAEQKSAGNKHIVVDKETFVSRYWSYSDWSNPYEEGIDDWPNNVYAKVYGVETFAVK